MKHQQYTRKQQNAAPSVARIHELREINGKVVEVGLPRRTELNGLVAKFSMKPWTNKEERSYLEADIRMARQSLRGR